MKTREEIHNEVAQRVNMWKDKAYKNLFGYGGDKSKKDNNQLQREFEELLKSLKLDKSIKITSGYRPGAKTAKGTESKHASGQALDLQFMVNGVPDKSNRGFTMLRQIINSHPDVVKFMLDHNLGVLEEITPEAMKRNHSTGRHFHIGTDPVIAARYKKQYMSNTGNPVGTTTKKGNTKVMTVDWGPNSIRNRQRPVTPIVPQTPVNPSIQNSIPVQAETTDFGINTPVTESEILNNNNPILLDEIVSTPTTKNNTGIIPLVQDNIIASQTPKQEGKSIIDILQEMDQENIAQQQEELQNLLLAHPNDFNISNSTFKYALAEEAQRKAQKEAQELEMMQLLNQAALGGPLFNSRTPIESFQGKKSPLPEVRYANGGNLFEGTETPTQQMNSQSPRVASMPFYIDDNGYFYYDDDKGQLIPSLETVRHYNPNYKPGDSTSGLNNYYVDRNKLTKIPQGTQYYQQSDGAIRFQPTIEVHDTEGMKLHANDKPLEAPMISPEELLVGAGRAFTNGAIKTTGNLLKPLFENRAVQNLFAADAAYRQGLTDEGWKKTQNHIQNGEWGDAALSGAGDMLDLTMMAPTLYRGAKGAYDLTKQGQNWARSPYGLGFTPFVSKKDYMGFIRDQYNTAYNVTRPNLQRVVDYYGSKYKAKTGDKDIAIIDPEGNLTTFSLSFTDQRNRKIPIYVRGGHSWAMRRVKGNSSIPAANKVSIVHHDIPLIGKYFIRTPEDIQNTVSHEWSHGVQDVYGNWFKGLGYYDKTLGTPIRITDGFKFDGRAWSAMPKELGAEFLGQLGSKYGGRTYYELTPEEQLEFTNHLGSSFLLGLKNSNKPALFNPFEFKAAKENAKLLPERFETWSNNAVRTAQEQPNLLLDNAYMKAVQEGDMETAQAMRAEHAEQNGYNNSQVWRHARPNYSGDWTVFNMDAKGESGLVEPVKHVGTEPTIRDILEQRVVTQDAANSKNGIASYTETTNPSNSTIEELKDKADMNVLDLYLKQDNPLEVKDVPQHTAQSIAKEMYNKGLISKDELTSFDGFSRNANERIRQLMKDRGFDGEKYTNQYEGYGQESRSFIEPSQVKLADPVTYFKADDPEVLSGQFKAGDIIPLSMRDNFNRSDIRFGWLPFISTIGTGVGLSATSNNNQQALGGNLQKGQTLDLEQEQIDELIKQGYKIKYIK